MNILKVIGFAIFLLFESAVFATTIQWQELEKGLYYTHLPISTVYEMGTIHAFRFNLKQYHLKLAFAKDQNQSLSKVQDLVTANQALIGVNGGFFSTDSKVLGLRINNGKIHSEIRPISWWGIFYVKNNKAIIVPERQFHYQKSIQFAVQSGPRLIINGIIPNNLKPALANRTALGITKNGDVILLVTQNALVSTAALAEIMRKSTAQGGLGCVNALNLDGGSSTQIYAKINQFSLNIPSLAKVADAVLVTQ